MDIKTAIDGFFLLVVVVYDFECVEAHHPDCEAVVDDALLLQICSFDLYFLDIFQMAECRQGKVREVVIRGPGQSACFSFLLGSGQLWESWSMIGWFFLLCSWGRLGRRGQFFSFSLGSPRGSFSYSGA